MRRQDMISTIINIAAWILTGFFAFLLLRDFIRTERHKEDEHV